MGNRQELFKQETVVARNVRATLVRLLRYFAPYWYMVVLALAVMLTSAWMTVTTPQLTGQATDCFIVQLGGQNDSSALAAGSPAEASASACWLGATDPASLGLTERIIYNVYTSNDYPAPSAAMTNDQRIAGLLRLTLIMAVMFVASSLLFGLTFFVMTWAAQHVIRKIRLEVFEQLHRLSLSYYSEHTAGDLMSRITNDTSALEQGTSFALVQFISGIIQLVWISYNMLTASLPFALLSLSVAPIMFLATLYFSAQARKAFRTSRKEIGNVNAELQETISAVREVQAFNRADENIEQFKEVNAANRDANVRAVSYTSALAPVLEALSYVALAIVVGVGGWALLSGNTLFGTVVSFGLIITFLAYVQRFNQPIQQIAVLWTNIQNGIAGAERIFNILDEQPAVFNKTSAQAMPPIKGLVEFTDASHSYEDGVPVLKNVSFTAQPGQTIAIVGPTGAGKTTIINLLPRFYDVTSGSVKIDGIDVRDVTMKSLREQIGIVLQDTFLFSQSVMENVRFGKPTATDDEVMAAIKLANADSFIERLPEKYQTVLGERGSGLSQGQRQLLSIARAALSDPKILILDEATSSVDTRTERLIQKAFDELLKGRTAFVIAHRLSTIQNADMILVLKDGQIIERGKHDDLLAKRGFYYDLYMSQFKKQEELEVVAP
ncbi:MAG: ABC transporter ATP-binding protein [Anaerolineales bacterium]|nr:ABC transporter ATP-binding protein [Anaerolineales bacterium]